MKRNRHTKKLMATAIAAVLASASASAVTVDGIASDAEYLVGTGGGVSIQLGFADDQHKTANPIQGFFRFVTIGDYVYAALSAPTDFVDNVYGADADLPDSGWHVEEIDKKTGEV